MSIRDEFVRAFDEVFEDILIRRWRGPVQVRNFGKAQVVEDEDAYRVKIAIPDVDPEKLEVEVSEWRLTVRTPGAETSEETILDFSHWVDTESVSARLEADLLEVFLPKARGRKIEVP